MYKINRILPIVILIVMTSCQKVKQQDTAVLSKTLIAIIDYFLDENKAWLSNEHQLVIEGYMENSRSSFYLNIWDNDSSLYRPYGQYNGNVYYKGYDISLYGDSWNDFFWKGDSIHEIPNRNNPEEFSWFYDPTEWYLVISCNDTTINRVESEFSDFSSLSYEEYQRILCDSLTKIICQ